MPVIPISYLPNVTPANYTPQDLLVLVNYYDAPYTGVTKNTYLSAITSYIAGTVSSTFSGGTISGFTNFTNGVSISGTGDCALTVDGNVCIDGDLNITGNTNQYGSFYISGDTTGCTLTVDGNLCVTGDLNVSGNTTLSGLTATTISATSLTLNGQVFNSFNSIDGANSRRWTDLNNALVPGSGQITIKDSSLLTLDPSLVDNIFVSRYESTGADMNSWFTYLENYLITNPDKAYIEITDSNDNTVFGIYEITDIGFFPGDYWKILVNYISGSVNQFSGDTTITVSWVLFGADGPSFTGGTVSGATTFLNGITATTTSGNAITAIGNVYISGDTGCTLTIDGNVCINGDLNVTGNTTLNNLTANTISASTYYNYPGSSSATCITDFYVTNVHGCSPITIMDEVQSYGSSALGTLSFAFGDGVNALGEYSHAEGIGTTTNGDYSHAEGYRTKTFGVGDHSEGIWSQTATEMAYETTSINGGLFALFSGYSNVTSHFDSDYLYVYDPSTTDRYLYVISAVTYDMILDVTSIQIIDTSISSLTNFYVINPFKLQNSGGDKTMSGFGSHSEGYYNTSIGIGAHSEGNYINALDEPIPTLLSGNHAIGYGSHAEGAQTKSIGNVSHSEGIGTISIGLSSHSEGSGTTAYEISSHSEGSYTESYGQSSHSEGKDTMSIGVASHSEGNDTTAGLKAFRFKQDFTGVLFIELDIDLTSEFPIGEGVITIDNTGNHSSFNIVSTNYIPGLGFVIELDYIGVITTQPYIIPLNNLTSKYATEILGNYSHSEGNLTNTYLDNSHSEGYDTNAYGKTSHSEGSNTTTYGEVSHAEGMSTTTYGVASHSEGKDTNSGWRGYLGNCENGVITIYTRNDIISEFPGDKIIVYDNNDEETYVYSVSSVTFNYPNIIIQLNDLTVSHDFPTYIASLSNLSSEYAGYLLGDYSHSEGFETKSLGKSSHSEGNNSNALGESSHSEGKDTNAYGEASHSEGGLTNAYGEASHSEGKSTKAYGDVSHAEGYSTKSIGLSSHSEGFLTTAGWKAFNCKGGDGYLTIQLDIDLSSIFPDGNKVIVLSIYDSFSIYTIVSTVYNPGSDFTIYLNFSGDSGGIYIVNPNILDSEYATTLLGDYSHSEGLGTVTFGQQSHAEGNLTKAYGNSSHSEGESTETQGTSSHSEGDGTTTYGEASHAEGYSTSTGFRGFEIFDYSNGIITISDQLGNITSEFPGDKIVIYNSADGNTKIYSFSSTTYNGLNTEINLLYNPLLYIPIGEYVADLDKLDSEYAFTLTSKYSHSEGDNTKAVGEKSHSEGKNTKSCGLHSHSEGELTNAYGQSSHAEGYKSIAEGIASHAEGGNVGDDFAGGWAIGIASHAEGEETISIGESSHAEGYSTTAGWKGFGCDVDGGVITITSQIDLTSEFGSDGDSVILTDNYSNQIHIISGNTSYSYPYFTITLYDNTVSGTFNVADLQNLNSQLSFAPKTLGLFSHSEGSDTKALGDGSHTEGLGTIASGFYQHVSGKYNLFNDTTEGAFIVGNGDNDSSRSNLLFAGGNNVNINGNLNVSGVINLTGASEFMSTTGISASTLTIPSGTTYFGSQYSNVGPVALTLFNPTGLDGLKLIIKDESGNASTNPITLTPSAGSIDGSLSVIMSTNYMSLTLVARNGNWWII